MTLVDYFYPVPAKASKVSGLPLPDSDHIAALACHSCQLIACQKSLTKNFLHIQLMVNADGRTAELLLGSCPFASPEVIPTQSILLRKQEYAEIRR